MKLKNLFFGVTMSLTFITLSSFTGNSSQVVSSDSKVLECCTASVVNEETTESATIKRCAATMEEACKLAYEKASIAVGC